MAIITATLLLLVILLHVHVVTSFTIPSASSIVSVQQYNNKQSIHCKSSTTSTTTALHGLFDNDTDASDKPSEIPPELRDEIFAAEANTPAAQGRQQRIITYIVLTFLGVTTAFFNAFLSDLRFGDGAPSEDLAYYGFDWVANNVLLNFAFTNKIGGALGLLGAGLSGTLAEVEIRSKKENAEKIWQEIERRQTLKDNKVNKKKKKRSQLTQSRSKRDMTGTQKKRLSALEELMVDDDNNDVDEVAVQEEVEQNTRDEEANTESKEQESTNGIMGKIKGFYDKADSMAASQALLLNKELEDRGVIDKITDESGLKVIGKEAAAEAGKSSKTDE